MYNEKPSLDDYLLHYGVDHVRGTPGSGRYPWGSGDNPNQHSGDFLSRVRDLRKNGITYTEMDKNKPDYGHTYKGETAIAKTLGMKTTEYRQAVTLATNLEKMAKINQAEALYKEGYGYSEIARKMGLPNESSARSLLKPTVKANIEISRDTAEFIKNRLEEKGQDDPKAMVDIGAGVENSLGITRTKLDNAVYILEGEGYNTFGGRVPNITDPTGAHQTTINAIGLPGTTWKDFYDRDNNHIYSLEEYQSKDGGETFKKKFEYPESLDSNRLMVRYAEQGGKDKDGLIELRRGVDDISLGEKNYAQVRILVDDDHYLKGMAAYAIDQSKMPKGIDVIFNTNKHEGTPLTEVLKEVKRDKATGEIDRDNPFGSLIKDKDQGGQFEYFDSNGNKKLGLLNKRADEGDWDKWKDTLSAQFLSKQTVQTAKRQLDLAIVEKQQELDDIMSLTNNTVKKYYLESFASDCDSAAVHLTAAALPRQKFQVILPITTMKDNEVYAPNYKDGEQVALVRYPHGGTFEIPILTVNNKQKDGIAMIGKNSKDAIGINAKVAERLSGADFDGDTVMVIPTGNKVRIRNSKELPGLKGFDPKEEYGCDKSKTYTDSNGNTHYFNKHGIEFKPMTKTQLEMGKISNLITDMTIKGATREELAKAVRHSMVVIDAEKHKLDWKSSEAQNDIATLKKKYQVQIGEHGEETYGGASTLISKAKSQLDVPKRKGQPRINIKGEKDYDPTRPEGALLYKNDPNATFEVLKTNKKTGNTTVETKIRTQRSTKMAETDDARSLISDRNTQMEQVYASFANTMKALANRARKLDYDTKGVEYNTNSAKKYKKEVKELEDALDRATKNKPKERQAQIIATSRFRAKKQSNPDMSKEDLRKVRQQEITRARAMVGATREEIVLTSKQWEAIQSGAVHANTLKKILTHTDADKVREMATPSSRKTMTSAMLARAKAYKDSGKTNAEIAAALGVSSSTISKYLSEA